MEAQTVDKVWLKSYAPGVPAVINPDAYQSLVEIFAEASQRYYDSPAYYNMGKTMTYGELDNYSTQFAAYLQNDLKLTKGDRLAIMLPNILQYPVVLFGALKAGLIVETPKSRPMPNSSLTGSNGPYPKITIYNC